MSSSSGWSLFLRVGQLLSTLVPIWLTREDTLEVGVINWCLFIWPICFSLTLLGFILELGSLFKLPLGSFQCLLRLYDKFQSLLRLYRDGGMAFSTPLALTLPSSASWLPSSSAPPTPSSMIQAPPETAPSPPLPSPVGLLCCTPSKWPGSVADPVE